MENYKKLKNGLKEKIKSKIERSKILKFFLDEKKQTMKNYTERIKNKREEISNTIKKDAEESFKLLKREEKINCIGLRKFKKKKNSTVEGTTSLKQK